MCVSTNSKRFPNCSIKLWEVVGNGYEIVGVLRLQVMRKKMLFATEKVHEIYVYKTEYHVELIKTKFQEIFPEATDEIDSHA